MAFSRRPGLKLIKLSATGNDFLLADLIGARERAAWKKAFGRKSRAALVRGWCDRHEGLGADGFVFLDPDRAHDFAWDFYNSDGSRAEMCGNAARAVSAYFHATRGKKSLRFRSRVGTVEARVKSARDVEVTLPAVTEHAWSQTFTWETSAMPYDFVRAGVPHAVVRVPKLDDRVALERLARAVKGLPVYADYGTNVTFLRELGAARIESVTFERGVEGFTLSCGTGAVAAAFSILRGEENRAVEVRVPGGTLFVIWKEGRPHLRGPAKIVAEMHPCP